MKITRTLILQVGVLGVAAGLAGFGIARTWKRDADMTSITLVVVFICFVAALLPAFKRKA